MFIVVGKLEVDGLLRRGCISEMILPDEDRQEMKTCPADPAIWLVPPTLNRSVQRPISFLVTVNFGRSIAR